MASMRCGCAYCRTMNLIVGLPSWVKLLISTIIVYGLLQSYTPEKLFPFCGLIIILFAIPFSPLAIWWYKEFGII